MPRRRSSRSSGGCLPNLRSAIAGEAKRIRQTALALAEVDVLACFAHIAALRNYCRPKFEEIFDGTPEGKVEGAAPESSNRSGDLEIIEGRHPVIEQQELTAGASGRTSDLFRTTFFSIQRATTSSC